MAMDTQPDSRESARAIHDDDVLVPGAYVGQYELIRELGRGGMGVVFSARDTRLGRRVAIKFVHHATGEIAQRFMLEARALARCEHPNIVVIHAVDEHLGLPYLVLEFLEGHSLREVMMAAPRLPPSRVVELILPAARALARAHEQGIIHRDLKPENLFLTSSGQIKVLDFGIAKAASEDERTSSQRLTQKHSLLGTMTYMSPEQMGTDLVDTRTDVWALGIMMFEMIAGHHPIDPPTTEALITNAVSDDPMPSLADASRDVPAALVRAIDMCLIKNKEQRLTSAALVQVLESLAPGRRARTLGADESPYPGLAAFQETDAGRFFGRDAEIARMVARVREHPLSGVIGPSGAGKSSFVRAGVGPALKASGEPWEIIAVRPGRSPVHALAAAIQRATAPVDKAASTQKRGDMARRMLTEPGYLGSLLRQYARRSQQRVLLFVDQMEELFTLATDPSERQSFLAALLGIADDPSAPLRVVVSIRSDFVDRLVESPVFVEELSRSILLLSTPDRAGLRDALEQPLALEGYSFESEEIVEDMLAALENTSGALPLLQFAASKLWDGREKTRNLITVAGYQAIGGLSGALATHADEVMAKLDTGAQKLAQRILRALVTPERTRAVVEIEDLFALASDRSGVARVIDQLVAARLVVVQKRAGGGGTAELVHESLIASWPALRRWIDEDQDDAAFSQQIAAAAKQWEARGRAAGLVWRGEAAAETMRWIAVKTRELAPRERDFVEAVDSLRTRGHRRRRRAVIAALVALGGIAAGAIVATIMVNSAREDAIRNSAIADHNAQLWREAASALDDKKREQAIAEARAADAQRETQDVAARAQAQTSNAERERVLAEQAAQAAQSVVKEKESQVVEGREALVQKNQQLEQALRDQRAATEKAERATAEAQKAQLEAQQAQADAERTKAELQKALDVEKKRAAARAEEGRKLSNQLKE